MFNNDGFWLTMKLNFKKTHLYYPISKVSNVVSYVNPFFNGMLKGLTKGEPSKLGFSLDSSKVDSTYDLKLVPGSNILINNKHTRSGVFAKAFLRPSDYAKRPHPYPDFIRDLELKGCGFNPDFFNTKITDFGFQDRQNAIDDSNVTDYLAHHGLRVVPHIAHIRLNEIIINGEKYSIEEAKEKELISKGIEPILIVRGFGTRNRVEDLLKAYDNEKLINDAIDVLSIETGNSKKLTQNEYAEWFAKNLGRQIGLMDKLKFLHYALSSHQVTLDGRIVDFAGSQYIKKDASLEEQIAQYASGLEVLKVFSNSIVIGLSSENARENKIKKLEELYKESFQKTIKS